MPIHPTFLDEVAQRIHDTHGDLLHELVIVVPNKRAVVFLKRSLAQAYGKVIWSPKIVPVQQFFLQASEWVFPESITLVLALYEVYRDVAQERDPSWNEPLESFFSWGEMLLGDFDEVDKYLVQAEKLFSNILDLREIDLAFSLTPEDHEALRQLWQSLRGQRADRKEMESRFLNLWHLMHPVYEAFRKHLMTKGLAYEGMAYRQLAESVASGERQLPAKRYLFVGFNALLKAEERLLEGLLSRDQATVYWDVHSWYYGGENQQPILGKEPGKFIQSYHQAWQAKGWDTQLIACPKVKCQKIYLVGAPQNIAQAKYLGMLLSGVEAAKRATEEAKEKATNKQLDWAKHAVVLAEEKMLFPTLEVLPETVKNPNVTMGYPLRQTHIFHLIDIIIQLLRNRKMGPDNTWLLAFQDVQRLLLHPYVQTITPESEKTLRDIAQKNLLWVPATLIQEQNPSEILAALMNLPAFTAQFQESVQAVTQYLDRVLAAFIVIQTEQPSHGESQSRMELDFLLILQEKITQLSEALLAGKQQVMGTDGLARLIRQALQGVRIPFEGEPLQGLQIMGFLETRGLDFDQIYILGANEGLLPNTASGNSFIPYLLRKGFGMPTSEEKDAIYAYHFYRFLQRSREVYLIYDRVTTEGGGGKEPSRFIQQIRFFLRGEPEINVIEYQASASISSLRNREILIHASDATRAKIQARFSGKNALSPTAINTYRNCSLQFYFRYLANIRERDTVDMNLPANVFGSLLHKVMELVYESLPKHSPLSKALILAQRAKLESYLEEAVRSMNLAPEYLLQGENILKRQAILSQCEMMLNQDAADAPFEVVALEQETSLPAPLLVDGIPFNLKGTLDRIDRQGQQIRILDYKTGMVKLRIKWELDELFEKGGDDLLVQGMMYAWLYASHHLGMTAKVGFFPMRKPSQGVAYLLGGKPVSGELIEQFGIKLQGFLERLVRDDFRQTEDLKICEYCPYRGICQRDL